MLRRSALPVVVPVGLCAMLVPRLALAAGGAPLDLAAWSVVPFVLLLLSIALFPLLAPHWWHQNRNRAMVSLGFAMLAVLYLAFVQLSTGQNALGPLAHELWQYVAFMALLGSLYVVAGGILVKGRIRGTPLTNTGILALGAVLANLVGTTGASMLLIRLYLRANRARERKKHLPIFFIFVVGNVGGLLTPLGDPPLFLGFLNHVPFFWTLSLWFEWLLVNASVLTVFLVWDTLASRRETASALAPEPPAREPVRLEGLFNLLLLGGVIGAVLLQGQVGGFQGQCLGSTVMVVMGLLSLALTPRGLRAANGFTWGPIAEVAILFVGIFATMVPALELLGRHGKDLGISEPWQYFWLTGLLSGFLDNAPTYLTFATIAAGSNDFNLLVQNSVPGINGPAVLGAISCGAVFMGALTYIGNGPNFMVKAIAEESGFPTPSFFGYFAYACAVLIPILAVVNMIYLWL